MMASATTSAIPPASFQPASNSVSATRSTDRHCSMTWKRLWKNSGWSETRRRKRQRRPRPQPCPCRRVIGTSLATRVNARKCGQSWFKDWDRGVGGGVVKRPLLLCPGPNELPRRGSCLAEAAEFRFTGVSFLYGPESLRAQGGSVMEVRCAGADEGGYAGGSAKRRAAGRPHRAPLRERVGRGLRLKGTGLLWAGWKGASASEAVAEYSMVGRAKAGACARRGCCGSRAR